MPDEYLSVREHVEFARHMEAENEKLAAEDKRQNHRLDEIEKTLSQINSISVSVERLAVNMENMLKEQITQGERLGKLESRDGDSWRSFKWLFVGGLVTIFIAFIAYHLGLKA